MNFSHDKFGHKPAYIKKLTLFAVKNLQAEQEWRF